MLLEEALAGSGRGSGSGIGNNNNNNNNSNGRMDFLLSPHDAALALLSFLRDELPAGGTVAERRFVGLFPLIVDRVFGEWNAAPSSPSPSVSSPSTTSSPATSSSGGGTTTTPDYRHGEGGWLGRRSAPAVQARRRPPDGGASPSRSPASSSFSSSSSYALEEDPIVRLLRAPPPASSSSTDDDDDDDGRGRRRYAPPTLIDALDAESRRRPDALFGFPLAALSRVAPPTVEAWRAFFLAGWSEMEERGGGGSSAAAAAAGGGGLAGKENAARMLELFLGPRDQPGLRDHFRRLHHLERQQAQPRRGGGFGGQSSPPPTAHSFVGGGRGGATPTKYSSPDPRTPSHGTAARNNADAPGPRLELTMLEYYLLLFVRFPLSNTTWTSVAGGGGPTAKTTNAVGVALATTPSPFYGRRVYRHLFAGYLNWYLPHGRDRGGGGGGGRRPAAAASSGPATPGAIPGASDTRPPASLAFFRDRESELFLRLLIELWIEGPNVAPTTSDAVSRRRRVRSSSSSSREGGTIGDDLVTLRDSLELARPVPNVVVVAPPSEVMIGVLTLVRHLVSDVSVREMVHEASVALQRRQREEREGDGGDSGGGGGWDGPSGDGRDDVPWPLPPALTVAQPSAYNYIRLGLACGAIHDRSSMFHGALEAWLAWLEPWNYVLKRRAAPVVAPGGSDEESPGPGGSAGEFLRNAAASVSSRRRVEYHPAYRQPKPTSPSEYDPRWESYVVCNAHYYTVPLAIFLRRARELDFSSSDEYPRSLALVQRVLRVYSRGVVNVLNGVMNPRRRADALTTLLFERHGRNMDAYCPPTTKLIDCQPDVTNLLEELYGQYRKRRAGMDILDRMEAKLNALFEGKMGGEEAALENILVQVRCLVQLPLDYQVLPDEDIVSRGLWRFLGLGAKGSTDINSDNSSLTVRGPDGKLTDLGRQELRAGLCKCDPVLTYIGDPMLSRVRSYEIPALVELTVWMSTYLNNNLHLQLTAPPPSPGMYFDDDDVLQKRFREMKQYEEAKLRINLRFLADRRTLVALLVIFFALSCDRPSWTRPSSGLHGLFSRAATEGTSRRGIDSRAGGRSTPRSRRRGG